MGNRENRLEIIIGAKSLAGNQNIMKYVGNISGYIVIYMKVLEIYYWISNQNQIKIFWNILLEIKSKSDNNILEIDQDIL